ncbi:MAG: hypothetical protein KKD63_13915 [Proteobacteria bacterium]|nr:hypothetical protein [Desulfobulbaceae bacterium]MBU4153965.1 hypothetical protein [Pseudomonadota bacterium]MDP2104905.1 ABC transporter substrate binding protein [Desulfobulbaceae bacterium]
MTGFWHRCHSPGVCFRIIAIIIAALISSVPAFSAQVGVIMAAGGIPYYLAIQRVIEEELAKEKDVRAEMIIERPAPNEMAWRNATRRLVTLESKVIIAYGGGTALAAMAEAPDLPVVFCAAFDPAASGIVGANVTGVATKAPLFALVNSLHKISNYRKLGILYSSSEVDSVRQAEIVASLGGNVVKTDVKGLDTIFFPDDVQAVFLTCAGAVQNQQAITGIIERARAGKIATASVFAESAEQGVLIAMSVPAEEIARKTAKIVAGVLAGGRLSGAPLLSSGSRAELVINGGEARNLGFAIPSEILTQARVVE